MPKADYLTDRLENVNELFLEIKCYYWQRIDK